MEKIAGNSQDNFATIANCVKYNLLLVIRTFICKYILYIMNKE